MSFDFDQENYRQLKELVLSPRRANIVPFVGAGLSLYGLKDRRLPGWWELVNRVYQRAQKQNKLSPKEIAEIGSALENNQNIEALGKLYSYTSSEWVSQTVESILEIEADGVSPAAVALMTISWTLIVTTNLDRMLELAHSELELQGYRPKESLNVFTSRNEDAFLHSMSIEYAARTSLAKIHGTVEDYRSFVLTAHAYNNLQNNGIYKYVLQDLFRRTLLIIGFSLSDPDFDHAMDHIAANFRARISPPYVVLPDSVFQLPESDPYRRKIENRQKYNKLRVITYHKDEEPDPEDVWGGHKELFQCINDLRNSWFENYQKFRMHGNLLPEEKYFIGRSAEISKIDELIFANPTLPCQIHGFGGEGKTALISHWIESRNGRLSAIGIKDAFVFNCYVDSPAEFFAKAGQILGELPPGMSRGEQRSAILAFAKLRKTLFVFDRFEIFQAPEMNGQIRDGFLRSFLNDLIAIGSPIIVTTRLKVPELGETISLKPLKKTEVEDLVESLLPDLPHPATTKSALEHLQGHAQSIILFLTNQDSFGAYNPEPYLPIADEKRQLNENKAVYTLANVQKSLSRLEDTVLEIASLFQLPFTVDQISDILSTDLNDFNTLREENGLVESIDTLYSCVSDLVNKYLMISNDGPTTYQLHPNVRDFYRSTGKDLKHLHNAFVSILRDQLTGQPIQNVAAANQIFSLAYHVAQAEDWPLFDYYYQQILMRGQEDFVCDTLGMWSETLDLTRLVFPNGQAQNKAYIDPAYYSSRYARSLKHLGYASDASSTYDTCLGYCAEELFPKTAIYLNNYLTLEIYRGNLIKAANMAPWNFAVMQWIEDENSVCNQIEHGGYSIGWLAMLMGDFATAQSLFDLARQAWKGKEEQQNIFFDYYPVYFCEMYLIEDRNDTRSQILLSEYLNLAQKYGWKETEARCHILQSMLHRHKARGLEDMSSFLQAAFAFCGSAEHVISNIFAPPVELELTHELLCLNFEDPLSTNFKYESTHLMKRFMDLRISLEWDLYISDEIAFNGLEAAVKSKTDLAVALLLESEKKALAQENILALLSPYRPISMLRHRLNRTTKQTFSTNNNSKSAMTINEYEPIEGIDLANAVKNSFVSQPSKY